MLTFLADLPYTLISLKELSITVPVKETGKTFEENAIIKAKYYCKKSKLPTIADDAGAEIDFLNGKPGVNTHRWAHEHRDNSDEEIINYTLRQLKGVPMEKRGMQLRSVLALALPGGRIYTSEGKIRGVVAFKPTRERYKGFPFRSLMYLPKLSKFYNHTELTKEENIKYNHRIKALKKLKKILCSI